VLDGKLFVIGGGLPGNTVFKAVHRFDPATTWEALRDCRSSSPATGQWQWGRTSTFLGGFRTVNGQRQGFSGAPYVWRYRPP
jgi:hypothetical protein